MTAFRRLAVHIANYSLGSVLAIVASFISFPLLTRLLSVDDYGIMSLIASILTFVVSIGKLGLQHSTFRFYSDARSGRSSMNMASLLSTSIYGMLGVGSAATIVFFLFTRFAPDTWWANDQIRSVMALASVLVLIRILESAFVNQWRAEERSGALSIYQVLRKYADIAIIIFALYHISKSVWGFYVAMIVSESAGVAVIAWLTIRRSPVSMSDFSATLFKAMLAFGIPMLGFELVAVLSVLADRYVIQHMLSTAELGLYSAAYNLSDSLRGAVIASVTAAAVPMYNRLYVDEGSEKTSQFLNQFLHVYAVGMAFLLCLMAALGTDFVVFLASEKYRAAGSILTLIVAGMALDGLTVIVGAGLYLKKRTSVILALALPAAILKVLISIFLIQKIGIAAVAIASIVTGVLLIVCLVQFSKSHLAVRLPIVSIVKFTGIAVVAYFAMSALWFDVVIVRLAVRFLVGSLTFGVLSLLMDSTLRRQFLARVTAFKSR